MKKPFSVVRSTDPEAVKAARLQHEADCAMFLALSAACSMLGKDDKSRYYKELSDIHWKRCFPLPRDALEVIPGRSEE